MEPEHMLVRIGFTDNEAKIYLALLGLGQCLARDITRKTRLNRTHVYDRLYHLVQKGVVSYAIRAGKKYFQALPPQGLLDKVREQEATLAALMPQFTHLQKQAPKTTIEIYEGKEGLKSLLHDMLKERKPIYVMGFRGEVARQVTFYYPWFQKDRIRLGLKRKMLADPSLRSSPLITEGLTSVRFLPRDRVPLTASWTYGKKTVLFIPDSELLMVLITSAKVAQTYLSNFNLIWEAAKA